MPTCRLNPIPGCADGLFLREWRPDGAAKGVFLLLHGMESHSGWYDEFAGRLADRGWAAIAWDRRGWGQSPGPRGHLPGYGDFVEEASAVATLARRKYGPVHGVGMSWGGMALLYLGLRRGWLFDSLSLLAPGLTAKIDIPLPDKFRVAGAFIRNDPTRRVEPCFRPEHFTQNHLWQKRIADDPDRVRTVTASFCVETVKMRRFIGETAGKRRLPPTRCLLAGDDAIIDNARAGELCRRAGAAVEIVPFAAHTLIFENPALVAERLATHAETASRRINSPGRVWIAGGGAVGGQLGSLLSFGGREVGMLVKPQYAGGLAQSGFRLGSGHAGRTTGPEVAISATPDGLPADPDLVVLAVKSFDTASVLETLSGFLPPHAVLASLQNGIDNEAEIASAFPNHAVIAASICASLEMTSPGIITWADDRGGLGAACHQGDPERAASAWERVMPAAGMETRWFSGANAVARLKWSKLMLNAGFNALNSITGLSSQQILKDRKHGRLAVMALREGFSVMERLSLKPVDLPGFPVSKLRLLVKMPLDFARRVMAAEAGRAPEAAFSMRQDMLKKRKHTEINHLNGAIAQAGRRLGAGVEANEKLIGMVEDFFRGNPV